MRAIALAIIALVLLEYLKDGREQGVGWFAVWCGMLSLISLFLAIVALCFGV